jgi:hypothetical protein
MKAPYNIYYLIKIFKYPNWVSHTEYEIYERNFDLRLAEDLDNSFLKIDIDDSIFCRNLFKDFL